MLNTLKPTSQLIIYGSFSILSIIAYIASLSSSYDSESFGVIASVIYLMLIITTIIVSLYQIILILITILTIAFQIAPLNKNTTINLVKRFDILLLLPGFFGSFIRAPFYTTIAVGITITVAIVNEKLESQI